MFNKTSTALLLAFALGGVAQAQTACPCNGGVGTKLDTAAIQALLPNRMVCASVGSEKWQEHHLVNGDVWDYKLGPTDKVDPSKKVGTYAISGDAVTYTYGTQAHKYAVCQSGGTTTFCGAAFGGRDITGAVVSGVSGLQSCSGVSAATSRLPAAGAKPAATAKPRVTPATTTKP